MTASSPAADWNVLVAAATLGTGRAPPATAQMRLGDGTLLAEAAAPTRLLRAAIAADLWRIAGTRAAANPDLAKSAAPPKSDTAPARMRVVSELACWRFSRMLAGERRELVGEWLQHAAATGATLPVHWLPTALEALRPDELVLCGRLLGPEIEWLASENPAWQSARVTTPSEQIWQTGTLGQREAELQALRMTDPTRARHWIESTWDEDPPEARESFLRILQQTLGPDDEALLERGLDDKRKGVRRAAAAGLTRLPGSAHAARMCARLQPLLAMPRGDRTILGMARRRKLEVRLPTAPDKDGQRDGIELKPPTARKIGERSFWLVQMLAVVPPVHWSREFDCTPAVFLAAAAATDYATDLLVALSEAAVAHPDEDWLRALCAQWLDRDRDHDPDPSLRPKHLAELIGAASPATQLALLQQLLTSIGERDFQLARSLMSGVRTSWDAELTRDAIRQLAAAIRRDTQTWVLPRTLLADWAMRADAATAIAPARELLDSLVEGSAWRGAVEALVETLDFRHSMKKELLP